MQKCLKLSLSTTNTPQRLEIIVKFSRWTHNAKRRFKVTQCQQQVLFQLPTSCLWVGEHKANLQEHTQLLSYRFSSNRNNFMAFLSLKLGLLNSNHKMHTIATSKTASILISKALTHITSAVVLPTLTRIHSSNSNKTISRTNNTQVD